MNERVENSPSGSTAPNSSIANNDIAWSISMTLFFAVVVIGLVALGLSDLDRFHALMWEDAFGEWATFFAFLLAGVVGLFNLIRLFRHRDRLSFDGNYGMVVFVIFCWTGFCGFAAGEEISWAQRILVYQPPEMFQTLNAQQELNFHNILIYFVSPRVFMAAIGLGYGLAMPIYALVLRRQREQQNVKQRYGAEVVAPPWCLTPWFVICAGSYWTLTGGSPPEATELVLALVLLADMFAKARLITKELEVRAIGFGSPLLGVSTMVLAFLLAGLANPLLETFVFPAKPELIAKTRRELKAIATDLSRNEWINPEVANSPFLFEERVYTAFQNRLLFFDKRGEFRTLIGKEVFSAEGKRQTYFLDPWQNAYWIRMQGKGPVCLYSFGPNRRLDTVLDHSHGVWAESDLRGDDIAIWFNPFPAANE